MDRKNILVVDDSALMRKVTADIINSDERFCVTDFAKNGFEALDLIVKNYKKYEAVILDINMPRMSGIEVLEQLNRSRLHKNIIISSTLAVEGAKETIMALELGAFDFVTKPAGYKDEKSVDFATQLIQKLECAVADDSRRYAADNVVYVETKRKNRKTTGNTEGGPKLVFIAASTGGPRTLCSVIPMLPKNIDAPVVLVQHMPEGFTASFAARLDEMSDIKVSEATDGGILQKGHVYVAPGGSQMVIENDKANNARFHISKEGSINGLKPCADYTLTSLSKMNYQEIICVVLTGMGRDATEGIVDLSKRNSVYVISQNKESCVVYGMPKSIEQTGLVDAVLPLERIADEIIKHVGVKKNGC